MHLGRFHHAIDLLDKDFKSLNHVQLIQEVINALINLAANPANQDMANVYKTSLEKCRATLATSALNHPRPILKGILESISAEKYIGDALFSRIRSAIAENPAAPTLAQQALQKVMQDTQEFYLHVGNLNTSFTKLRVEYDELNEGEAEIGLLVPRDEQASTLKDLSKEFNQWHNALSPIVELFDPDAPLPQIKVCATTDWMVYLATTPLVLLGVSKCVRGVNTILRDLIETKGLIDKLMAKKVSPDAIEQLQTEHSARANTELRALAENTVDEHYKGNDAGRKNELKNALAQSLTTIAEKISSGAQLEVRMLPPAAEGAENAPEVGEDAANHLAELQALAQTLDNEVDALSFDGEAVDIKALLGKPEEAEAVA